jgi:hypothetical protein
LPAYQSDNFFSLLPGEMRRVTIEVPTAAARREMQVTLTGWNVRPLAVPVLWMMRGKADAAKR